MRHWPTWRRRSSLMQPRRATRSAGTRSIVSLGDLPLDVRELRLDEAGGVAHPLVVDRRPELADEEIEQRLCPEFAQRLVELGGEVLLDRAEQAGAALGRELDAHRRPVAWRHTR